MRHVNRTIRQLLVPLALAILAAAPAAAQRTEGATVFDGATLDAARIGVLGGGGIAWVSTSEREFDMRYRAGWSAGAYAALPVTNRFSVRAEALYSRKGVRIDLPLADAGQVITGLYESHYIEVPLLLQVDLAPEWDLMRPFFIAGPSPAYLLSRTYRVNDSSVPAADKTDDTKRFDVGLLVGGGAALPTSLGVFELNLRATFGLRDIRDLSAGAVESLALRGNNSTRNLILMAGYTLPLSRLPGLN